MREIYNKAKKQFMILCLIPIVSILTFAVVFVFFESSDSLVLSFAVLAVLIAFFVSIFMMPFKYIAYRSLKMHKDNFEELESGIDLNAKPDLEGSRIYCGDNAFYMAKERVIIPYEDVVWAFYSKTTIYIFIKISRAKFFFRNGKAAGIKDRKSVV